MVPNSIFFIKMELGPLLHESQLSPHYKALTMYDFNVLAEKMVFMKKRQR